MDLQRYEREAEGILIVELHGRLISGPDATGLRKRILTLIASGKISIILDLKNVEFIDSTGLGSLVIDHSAVKEAGGLMKLLNLSKRNLELLVLTKLTTLFEIYDNEQDAINSFFPDREIKRFDILEFVQSQETPLPE
jgi:anti-sigma B factor antagonist